MTEVGTERCGAITNLSLIQNKKWEEVVNLESSIMVEQKPADLNSTANFSLHIIIIKPTQPEWK